MGISQQNQCGNHSGHEPISEHVIFSLMHENSRQIEIPFSLDPPIYSVPTQALACLPKSLLSEVFKDASI